MRDICLFAVAAEILLEARLRLKYSSIDQMRRWSTMMGRRADGRDSLLLAFRRASKRLGGTCLVRALALQRLLSRSGHQSELRISVGRTTSGFEAHAWLVDDNDILEGEGQEATDFTLLATWPSDRLS